MGVIQMSYTADAIGPAYAMIPPEWGMAPEASPWNFEEPRLKRPRLGSLGLGGAAAGGGEGGASKESPSESGPLSVDRADWRWLNNLGELPPKRLRSEVAWPVVRSAAHGEAAEKSCRAVGRDCRERSLHAAPSTFEWGALPAVSEVMSAEASPAQHPASASSAARPPREEDAAVAMEEDQDGSAGRGSQEVSLSACTALVPYLRPASLASTFLRTCGALRIMPEWRISAHDLVLRERVLVAEVLLDDAEELYAFVVPESQVALAAFRFGQCPRPVETYDERGPGLRIVPLRGSSSSSGSGSAPGSCGLSPAGFGAEVPPVRHRPPTPRPPLQPPVMEGPVSMDTR